MVPAEGQEQTKSMLSSIMLPFVAVIMNMLTSFMNVLTPVSTKTVRKSKAIVKSTDMGSINRAGQHVLVTGCDRGFGYATAVKLDDMGFTVFAGCLDVNGDGAKSLQDQSSLRLKTLQLDVTNSEDIKTAEEWIREQLPEDKALWGLVNNAGVCLIGTPEIMAVDDISRVIDVNFRGTVNVTRTFLPLVRNAQGRVVNMGSINGDVPMPYFSIYCATKAAVRMFTESLAYEMQDWGVKACLVAPAGYKTSIIGYDRTQFGNKWWAGASTQVREDYGRDYFNMPMRVSGRIKVSDDYGPVVDSVVDALTNSKPQAIYRPGQGGVMLPALVKYSPNSLKQYLCGSLLNFISGRPQALVDADSLTETS